MRPSKTHRRLAMQDPDQRLSGAIDSNGWQGSRMGADSEEEDWGNGI